MRRTALFLAAALAAPLFAADAPAPAAPLESGVFNWDQLQPAPTKTGERRYVFDGPTATVDLLHCHISTLNPGERSGEPRLHVNDEVIIVKEGTVQAHFDDQVRTADAGAVIFFASNATTFLENTGIKPATYIVIYYRTPLTPKN